MVVLLAMMEEEASVWGNYAVAPAALGEAAAIFG